MSILITGGTGFLGRYLARHLLCKGEGPVVLFSRFPNCEAVAEIADRVTLVQGDCSVSTDLLRAIKTYQVKDVFHMASYVGEADRYPAQAIRANVVGTNNVFEVAMLTGVRRVVWSSTASVNPSVPTAPEGPMLDETTRPAPESIYGASKLFSEIAAENYRRKYGFDYVALRPTSVFGLGRRQRRGGGGGIYADMIETLASGERYVAPPANHKIMWAYVLDCVEAFYCAWKAERLQHRIFTFGGEVSTVGETVGFLKTLLPRVDVVFGCESAWIVPFVSDRLLREETGYRPRYGMKKGIADYVSKLGAA